MAPIGRKRTSNVSDQGVAFCFRVSFALLFSTHTIHVECPSPLFRDSYSFESGISNSRTPASFIRPAKPKDRTFSFLEALRLKYGSTNDNDLTGANQNGISIGSKTVEEIGFEKIRRQMATLQELGIVVLDDLCITGIKNNEDDKWEEQWIDLDSQELNITTLDLSRNLLERWDDVLGICNSLFRTLRYLTLE